MKHLLTICVLIAVVFTGCEKPGPIELVDNGKPSQTIEIDTSNDGTSTLNPSNDEIDSSGYFGAINGKTFGQIIVAGARYDALNEHHQASVAQAMFFDKNQPVFHHGDTIGYKIINAGEITVNGLQLFRYPKKAHEAHFLDTLLGFQYGLYNNDGVGGRGFQYNGSTTYLWQGTGSVNFPSFSESIKTSPLIRVTAPPAGSEIDPTKNLRFQLEGDIDEVTILIQKKSSLIDNRDQKPLLKLRVKKEKDGFVIPSTVLKLLPRQQNQIIFSFQVERNKLTRISGYPYDVLMTASYVHHIALRIRR